MGYGGSYFPKELESFVYTSSETGERFKLLEEVTATIENRFLSDSQSYCPSDRKREKSSIGEKKLFPFNIDDLCDAKSADLWCFLLDAGAQLRSYDPVSVANAKLIIGEKNIDYFKDTCCAAKGADAIVIVTEWREFTHLGLGSLGKSLSEAVIFDERNIYSPDEVPRAEIECHCIGRRTAYPSEGS